MTAAPDFPFVPDLLRHVSPIEWKGAILYGENKFDPPPSSRCASLSVYFCHESGRHPKPAPISRSGLT